MLVTATEWVNWAALGKIVLAALIGGSGVVIVFGILLIGLKYAHDAKNEGKRLTGWALAGICGVFCVGAAVIGIVAMADTPASKAKKAHKSAQVLTSPRHPQRRIA